MSVVSQVESEVVDTLSVYSEYRRAILFKFMEFLASSKAKNVVNQGELMNSLLDSLEIYAKRYAIQMTEASENVIELTVKSALEGYTENPLNTEQMELVDEFFVSMISRAEQNILYQMQTDAANLVTTFKRYLIHVGIRVSEGYSIESAHERERMELMNNFDLYRRDSLGRKRDSEQFVFTELRFSLYRGFNICMVYILSILGDERGRVERPGHDTDGKIIRLEDFDGVEESIFHPNATALLLPLNAVT